MIWWRRLVFIPSLLLTVFLLLLLAVTAWLLYTESGLKSASQLAMKVEPRLIIQRPKGSLLGELRFGSLSWQQDDVSVVLGKSSIRFLPVCFFSLNICVDEFRTSSVVVQLSTTPSEPEESTQLPEVNLPFELLLAKSSILSLAINRGNDSLFAAQDISLKNLLWQASGLSFSRLQASSYGEQFEGRGKIKLVGAYPLNLEVHSTPVALGVLLAENNLSGPGTDDDSLSVQIKGSLQQLQIAAQLEGVLSIQATAEAALLDKNLPFSLSLHSQGAITLQQQENHFSVNELALSAEGDLQDVVVEMTGNTQLPLLAQASAVVLQASSDFRRVDIQQLSITNPQFTLLASGQLYTDQSPSALTVSVKHFDPSLIDARYSGAIDAELALTLKDLLASPVISVALTAIDGEFLTAPVTSSGLLQWHSSQGFSFDHWQLNSNQDQLALNGTFPKGVVQWQASIKNLQPYLPEVSGALKASGSVAGALANADIKATINASSLEYEHYQLDRLSGLIDIKQLARQSSRVSLLAEGLVISAGVQPLSLELTLSGSQQGKSKQSPLLGERLLASVSADIKQGEQWSGHVDCAPTISLSDFALKADCKQLTVAINEGLLLQTLSTQNARSTSPVTKEAADLSWSRWKNDQPIRFNWQPANQHWQLQDFCLRHQQSSICLADQRQSGQLNTQSLALTANALPLAWGLAFLPDAYDLSGQWGFEVKLQQADAGASGADAELPDWQIQGQLATEQLVLTTENKETGKIILPVERLSLAFDANPEGFKGDLTLFSAALGDVLAKLDYQQQQLSGQLLLNQFKLQPLGELFVDLQQLSGELSSDLHFSFVDNSIELSGDASLHNLFVSSRSLPLGLSNGNLAMRFQQKSVGIRGEVLAGEGLTQLTGDGQWSAEDWRLELAVQAKDIRLEPFPRSYAKISSDIDLLAVPGRVEISGEISVPEARIEVEKLPENAVAVSTDSVIEDQSVDNNAIKVFADVKAVLGKAVSFRGFGLQTKLKGQLRIQQQPGQSLSGNGVVNLVEGRYRAYGQDLLIEEGRLIFAGPLSNPDLFVTAIRNHTDEDVRVGVRATGSVSEPQLTLFSSPAMSEQNTLYFLLTGNEPGSGSVDQSRLAEQTAIALSLAQSNKKARQIGEAVGISNFQMGTDTGKNGEEAQFSGYITPDLYLLYGVSLFDQLSSFTARYELSKDIYIEVYNSTTSAIDIFWTFSKN